MPARGHGKFGLQLALSAEQSNEGRQKFPSCFCIQKKEIERFLMNI